MQGFGYLLAIVGFVVLVIGLFQRMKAKRLADAPFVSTGDAGRNGLAVAAKNGAISAQGQVRCPQPVLTPMSGQPALYYKLEVTAEWKEREQNKSRVIETQEVAALFSIDDGSGEVWIDAKKGGSFEPIVSRSETQGTGLLGGITGQELAQASTVATTAATTETAAAASADDSAAEKPEETKPAEAKKPPAATKPAVHAAAAHPAAAPSTHPATPASAAPSAHH